MAAVQAACGGAASGEIPGRPAVLSVTAPEFASGSIPAALTCDGGDHPPSVAWTEPPPPAVEVELDLFDPDAGNFSHWLVTGIPSTVTSVPPLPPQAAEGVNDFGRSGYAGPCPPRGSRHRYVLRVTAAARALGLRPGARRADLYRALAGHEVAAGEVRAAYSR